MNSDEGPDLIAMVDQAIASIAPIASIIRAYHVALVREGFSEDQALQLTLAYQVRMQMGTPEP